MALAQYKKELLDEFEQKTDDWGFGNFESRLKEKKTNSYYQDAKSIIMEAHKLGIYPKTVKIYVISNYTTFGNSSMGSVFDDVYRGLSDDEKKEIDFIASQNNPFHQD